MAALRGSSGIQADAVHSRCLLYQILGNLSAFSGHDRARRQGKAQSVLLILEIQNDLPGHKNSPECKAAFTLRPGKIFDVGAPTSVTQVELLSIVGEMSVRL